MTLIDFMKSLSYSIFLRIPPRVVLAILFVTPFMIGIWRLLGQVGLR